VDLVARLARPADEIVCLSILVEEGSYEKDKRWMAAMTKWSYKVEVNAGSFGTVSGGSKQGRHDAQAWLSDLYV